MTEPVENTETEEVILDEVAGGEPGGAMRRIRVLGNTKQDDFIIDIPSECSMTFGYFNPAAPKFPPQEIGRYDNQRPSDVARATALRVYAGKDAKTPQIACFLGARGFRDLSIKLTMVTQRVVIETNFEDDGEGMQQFNQKAQRFVRAIPESIPDEDDGPF